MPNSSSTQRLFLFLAPLAGLMMLIALLVLVLALSSYGLLGARAEMRVAYAALALSGVCSGMVCGSMTDSIISKLIYMILGAAVFFLLAIVQAAMSEGHPDHSLPYLALWHTVLSPIGLWLLPLAKGGRKRAILLGAILALGTSAALAYGAVDSARYRKSLKSWATRDIDAVSKLILPRIMRKPPVITWSQPAYDRLGFRVKGRIAATPNSVGGGTAEMFGQDRPADFATFEFVPSEPFAEPAPGEGGEHLSRRMLDFLKRQGFTDEVLANFALKAPIASYQKELYDIPVDPQNPSSKMRFLEVEISLYSRKLELSLTPGPLVE